MSKLIHYSGPAGSYILPLGYTRLAYIQSTGTLWIDTRYVITSEKVTYGCKFLITKIVSNSHIYGGNNNPNVTMYKGNAYISGSNLYFYTGSTSQVSKPIVAGKIIDILLVLDSGTCSVYWQSKTPNTGTYSGSLKGGNSIALFHVNANGNWAITKGKMYNFKMWDNGQLVRDMVPVQTISTVTSADGTSCPSGSIGLLDLVENKFYLNKGTGTFIAGPECPLGFPTSEYCLVEWLESTGTLYINTGINYDSTNNNYHIQSRFQMTDVIRNYQAVYGAYTSESHNCFRLLRWNSNTAFGYGSNSLAGGGGTSVKVDSIFDEFEVDHTYNTGILTNLTRNKSIITTIGHISGTTTTSTFFLFAQNTNSGTTSAIKISYWKIYNDSTLVSHMIPCYRRSDMKPGMYDIVRKEFYTNSGTGEFLLGPSITFGWGEVMNSAPNSNVSYHAIPHNISSGEGPQNILNTAFLVASDGYLKLSSPPTDIKAWSCKVYITDTTNQILFVDGTNKLGFGFFNGHCICSTIGVQSPRYAITPFTTGWHTIAYNVDTQTLYVDGMQLTKPTSTDVWTYSKSPLYIGNRMEEGTSYSWKGRFCDFLYFDSALSTTDISGLM